MAQSVRASDGLFCEVTNDFKLRWSPDFFRLLYAVVKIAFITATSRIIASLDILKYCILFLSVENLVVKAVSLLKDASNGDVERQDNITRKVFNVLSPNEKELSFLRNEFYSMVSHFCFATNDDASVCSVSCGCCDFKSCVINTTEIRRGTVL